MANRTDYIPPNSNNYYFQFDSSGTSGTGFWNCGFDTDYPQTRSGAMRFTGIAIGQGQTVSQAKLYPYANVRTGSASVKMLIEGFDEDNTADFSGGGPGSRPKTSATQTLNEDSGSTGYIGADGADVTAIVQEIVNRGGWSSGNAIGFWITDNGTTTGSGDQAVSDAYSGSFGVDSILSIRVASLPDFTPGPYSESVTGKPNKRNYGLRISKKNFDATINDISKIVMTSEQSVLKAIKNEERGWTTASNEESVSHQLKYPPMFISYYKSSNKVYLSNTNNALSGIPFTYTYTNPENISMVLDPNASDPDSWYYYIFIDENL